MKRLLLMLSILISFSMLANNESEIDEASVKHPKIVVSNTGDFPNPILKLWNFFFKDYKKVLVQNVKKSKSDTTVYLKERYSFK